MADRSITAKLRLDIGDLRAKAKQAGEALKGVGEGAKKGTEAAKTGFAAIGQSLTKNRAEWDTLAGAALKGGAVIAAGVGLAVKTYADFDKQMSSVAATGDDARQNIDALRETAIKLGADTQYSAGEAAQGIEELLKAGVSAADVVGGGLSGALDLAAAGQISVADAAETAATAMVQFKLSGQEVPHVADLLAAAAGKAQGGVSDIAQALGQGGLVAAQFGLSIEETAGTLAAFANAGLIGSQAGTSFRSMLLRLANPTGEAADLMKELGISAYDAQGNFVGMSNFAGQLKESLSGLSQSQRDQALATMFGSYAIQAANVLYNEGADGIAHWTSEVDDAGYAAITAATKTDNLAGDIERLGGALDTAFIRGGSGANDFLRGLVQNLERAVETASGLPSPVLEAGTAIAGIGAASLLAFGGTVKLATSAADTSEAMRTLSKNAPLAAKGIRGLSIAAGVAVGVTALFGAVKSLQSAMIEVPDSAEDMQRAVRELVKSGDMSSLDRMFTVDGGWFASIDGVNEAFEALGKHAHDAAYRFGEAGNAALGLSTEYSQAKEQIAALDAALARMDPQSAAKGFKQLSDQLWEIAGLSFAEIVDLFPELRRQAEALAEQADFHLAENDVVRMKQLHDIMSGDMPDAMRKSLEATEEGRKALEEYDKTVDDAASSLDDLTAKMQEQADAALAAADAQLGFEQAIDDATASAKENGKTLDVNTEKGRNNRRALLNLVSSSRDYIAQLKNTDASSKQVSGATQRATDSFLRAAKQMGLTQREAYELMIQYGLIPNKVTTDISAPGSKPTKKQVDEVNAALRVADEGARAEIISAWLSGGYDAAMRAIRSVQPKTVTITTRFVYTGDPNIGTRVGNRRVYVPGGNQGGTVDTMPLMPGLAAGGTVHEGPGKVNGPWYGPTADNVPARLNPREFVQPVASTDYYGFDVMEAMRTRSIPKELFSAVGLAEGGTPEPQRWQPSWSAPYASQRRQTEVVASPGVTINGGVHGLTAEDVAAEIERRRRRKAALGVRV